ncbi:MAG: signal peptide peptidase SppA [Bacteroidetes bacterium]|nr:signal peptide peptidase SppA [Bacteroidota bacterium]
MKQFFKFMFASMLGFLLTIVVFFLIIGAILSAIVSSASSDQETRLTDGTILHIYFKAPIDERSSDNPLENFNFNSFSSSMQPGLNDILKNIKKAAADANIEGIYLDLSGLEGGMASIEEIRNGLLEFKKSKKFIYAYSDYYTQGSYYMATVADEIWLNPQGVVEFKGMSAVIPFLKGLFEKLEIEPQVIRHGKFKSAIEPFILDKMSDENREQLSTYVNAFWNHFVAGIAESRQLSQNEIRTLADSMLLQTAEDALKFKMIDHIGFKDEFYSLLRKKTGQNEKEELRYISLKKYTKSADPAPAKEFTRSKIAVIYALGDIVSGKGKPDQIGSESLSETIRKAREDDNIKAVVLRVNSPGGDALASEIIWREMELCRKVKPVIVSMGDVAASGGYYISCNADTIVAQPNTITGSIGVFGLMFNAQKMFNNKLGITFDSYKTGPYSDIGSSVRPLTLAERQIMQNAVERVYSTFTKRVADGRNMPVDQVDSLGQGRVWSGVDAFKLGLVDVLGGLDVAISIAAKKAKLDNYRISELPEQKDPLKQIMEEVSGDVEVRYLKYKMGDYYQLYNYAEKFQEMKGVQARMFFDIAIQ